MGFSYFFFPTSVARAVCIIICIITSSLINSCSFFNLFASLSILVGCITSNFQSTHQLIIFTETFLAQFITPVLPCCHRFQPDCITLPVLPWEVQTVLPCCHRSHADCITLPESDPDRYLDQVMIAIHRLSVQISQTWIKLITDFFRLNVLLTPLLRSPDCCLLRSASWSKSWRPLLYREYFSPR